MSNYSIKKPYKSSRSDIQNVLRDSRLPTLIWGILIYFSALFYQLPLLPKWFEFIFFTGFILIHIWLHWYAGSVVDRRPWIYFVMQGCIVWACALFMPNAHSLIFVSLLTALAGQSIGVYSQRIKVFMVCTFYCALFSVSLVLLGTTEDLPSILLPLFFVIFFVIGYASLFYKQVRAKLQTQSFLHELERAHRKVEDLTIANERQRMARDLHLRNPKSKRGGSIRFKCAQFNSKLLKPNRPYVCFEMLRSVYHLAMEEIVAYFILV